MNIENANIIGLQAVSYIIGTEELHERFISLSGLTENDIRLRVSDSHFLSSCLEFLLGNEESLLSFCHESDIDPEIPMKAFIALGGNNNWDSM